jgi:MscS family membrane protein
MRRYRRYKGRVRQLLVTLALLAVYVSDAPLLAQTGANAASPAAAAQVQTERPKDSLGRDTPRGTLLGFMRAVREGNDEAAVLCLDTPLKGQAAVTLARQLYVVLDSRLPARVNVLSDDPEGSRANPLKPDQDAIGTISTADGPLELFVERVSRDSAPPIWLFSRRTLDAIPRVYDEIHLISFDRYLPDAIGRPRIAGIRMFAWLVLVLLLPLCYRLMGLARAPGPVRLFVLAISMHWLAASLDLPLRERQLWAAVAALLTMISIVWFMLRVNAYGERYVRRRSRDASLFEMASLVRLGRRVADVVVIVTGGLVVLSYFGVDPTAALAGLGIGGIAVALAAQKTLENVIGGLSIIFDKAVRVGDSIKLGEAVGTVDTIGLRSTRIRTVDRTILSVPNGQIATVSVETLSSRDMCWFRHVLGLRYETTSAQIRRVIAGIRDRLASHPDVDQDSLRARLFRFGPSSLDIEIVAYIRTGDWVRFLEIQEQLLVSMLEAVEEAGAAVAMPTTTLQISDERSGRAIAAIAPLPRESDASVSSH